MRVFAPASFRYNDIDYPYGWQDVPQSLADDLKLLGIIENDNPKKNVVSNFHNLTSVPINFSGIAVTDDGKLFTTTNGYQLPIQQRNFPVRVATFGDSTATICANTLNKVTNNSADLSLFNCTTWQSGVTSNIGILPYKFMLHEYYPMAFPVFNGGISGQNTTNMLIRDASGVQTTIDKSIANLMQFYPDVILYRGGSINDLVGVGLNLTQASMDAAVATCYANHIEIISRLTSTGAFVIDSGIHGYSGPGNSADTTPPDMARAALVKLNGMYAAYAKTNKYVTFLPYAGLVTDANGNFFPGYSDLPTGQGKHLMPIAQRIIAKEEAKILTALFGESKSYRYNGTNLVTNALFHLATAGLATGFTFTPTNCTVANTKIESINGKTYQTAEVTMTAASSQIVMGIPYNPTGTGTMAISSGDIYGFECDLLVKSMDGTTYPTLTGGFFRIDTKDSTGSGRFVVDLHSADTTWFEALNADIYCHNAASPYVFGDVSANLLTTSVFVRQIVFTGISGQTFKFGLAMPRIVKLNQPILSI